MFVLRFNFFSFVFHVVVLISCMCEYDADLSLKVSLMSFEVRHSGILCQRFFCHLG